VAETTRTNITKAQARRLIADHLKRAVEEEATVLHMCALAGEGCDEDTTFEDLIRIAFAGRRG